jgi:hypothetical protein
MNTLQSIILNETQAIHIAVITDVFFIVHPQIFPMPTFHIDGELYLLKPQIAANNCDMYRFETIHFCLAKTLQGDEFIIPVSSDYGSNKFINTNAHLMKMVREAQSHYVHIDGSATRLTAKIDYMVNNKIPVSSNLNWVTNLRDTLKELFAGRMIKTQAQFDGYEVSNALNLIPSN